MPAGTASSWHGTQRESLQARSWPTAMPGMQRLSAARRGEQSPRSALRHVWRARLSRPYHARQHRHQELSVSSP
jgi:hypothetical protein